MPSGETAMHSMSAECPLTILVTSFPFSIVQYWIVLAQEEEITFGPYGEKEADNTVCGTRIISWSFFLV